MAEVTPPTTPEMGPAMCESIANMPHKSAVLGYQSLARFARSALITLTNLEGTFGEDHGMRRRKISGMRVNQIMNTVEACPLFLEPSYCNDW